MGHLRDPEVAFQKLGSRGAPGALLRAVLCFSCYGLGVLGGVGVGSLIL